MPPTENDSSAARLAADTASGSQERLKREIALLLEEVGRMTPVVLCFDDLHWADPSTTDLLAYLARRIDNTRLLIITTARPSELAQAKHPFLPMKLDLLSRGMCREIVPSSLRAEDIARYLALRFPEHAFPDALAAVLHERTEGNPLFMADLVRDLRRRKVIAQVDGRWRLAEDVSVGRARAAAVGAQRGPAEARGARRSRIGGCSAPRACRVWTSTRRSSPAALQLREDDVEDRLERLEREQALVQFVDEWEAPDRTLTLRYRFAHHLYYNAFYDSLRGTRRAALSRADCGAARRAARRRGRRLAPQTSRSSSRRRATACAPRATGTVPRRRPRGCTRTTKPCGWRSAGLAAARSPSPTRRREPRRSCALQMTYGLALKTSRGYAVAGGRELPTRVRGS